jgi:3-deoxy-D-manno-octulosonic-acid transferase
MSARMQIYKSLQNWVVEPWLLPRWMSEDRLEEEKAFGLLACRLPQRVPGLARAWFHAASVGELESLMPVIDAWLAEGSEAVVTVLSESARGAVVKLRASGAATSHTGTETGTRVLYAGYSPWEGHWGRALSRVQPDIFITAKYEAWPELWTSLADSKIPLVIVSAKARRSLRIAGTLCKILGGKVPELRMLAVKEEDAEELRALFGKVSSVQIECAGEPRWDRVSKRIEQGSPRARELIARYRELPKPWGVLAQVWPEDMEVWRGQLGAAGGALWVVPHRVDAENVDAIEAYLVRAGLNPRRTSEQGVVPRETDCVLVDEMGFLLELYSAVSWAYVGGGFGVSMHSTIEPALFGLPIVCGPEGESAFPEIAQLQATGQLQVVRDREMLASWVESLGSRTAEQRQRWQVQSRGRLGATLAVMGSIRQILGKSSGAHATD